MEMLKKKKRVLIIGAGASGLPALKTALEYGFDAVCMERSCDVGGIWRFKENPEHDEGTVMKSTVINTSKEMTAYSDFPPPSSAANYMHNRDMLAYLRAYCTHFCLADCIRLRHAVRRVERTTNYNETGQWTVTYEQLETNKVITEIFDGVMVCTGHHSVPYWPSPFAGQSLFKGRIMHSHQYSSASPFENQTIVVVGIGNSGGDIAVELSKIAKKVYLSTRSGSWVINRVWDYGEPSDLVLMNRFTSGIRAITPRALQNRIMENKLNRRFDHARFGLKPAHRFLEAHVTVNDELPNRIASGTVIVKPNIAKFSETTVIFEDETKVADVDAVIFATGYSFSFPILEDGRLVEVNENKVLLYKHMFPIDLAPKNSLGIIGLIQPTGSIMPISEMQCRVFCAQLSGAIALPPKAQMLVDALRRFLKNKNQFVERRRHTLQVYYITYMESLARLLNVRPNLAKYMLKDPKLAKKLIFQGLVPYQYRLEGPHAWSGARDAILGVGERVLLSTRTRIVAESKKIKAKNDGPKFILKTVFF